VSADAIDLLQLLAQAKASARTARVEANVLEIDIIQLLKSLPDGDPAKLDKLKKLDEILAKQKAAMEDTEKRVKQLEEQLAQAFSQKKTPPAFPLDGAKPKPKEANNLPPGAADMRVEEFDVQKAEAELKIVAAKHQIKLAELARLKALRVNGIVAQETVDKASAEVVQSEAEMQLAQTILERARALLNRARNNQLQPPVVAPANSGTKREQKESIGNASAIDVRVEQADVLKAEAELKIAEVQLKLKTTEVTQISRLQKTGVVSQEAVDAAKAEVDQAQARVQVAQANLQRARALLDRAGGNQPKPQLTPPMEGKGQSLEMFENRLAHLQKLHAQGLIAEVEVDRARIAVAEARIAAEQRIIIDLYKKNPALLQTSPAKK
jgi:outer membrane protein TolC